MKKPVALLLLLVSSIALIAAKEIKGKVSNGESMMLQNVSIYLKNNPYVSVFTDENGEFVLSLEDGKYTEKDIVIFSHIAYETKEYQIKELSDGISHEVMLVVSPITLDDVIVVGKKLSRKEKKQRKISIIKQFKEQVERDFIFENRTYKIVSDVEVTRDAERVLYQKLIGEYKEIIGWRSDKADSIALTYTGIENYMDNDIELGIKKMSDQFIDNNAVSKKRKKRKQMLDNDFYKMASDDDVMLKKTLVIHKYFWNFNRDIKKRLPKLDDNPNKWEIIEGSENTILRFRRKRGILGIVKYLSVANFIVDPKTYSLKRISEEVSVELNIPFGYKLPPDALMLLNIIHAGSSDEMKKYRVRHFYVDAILNTIYSEIGTSKYVDEKRFDLNMSIIDTKKRNLKGESKALLKVLSIEDN